MTEDPREVCPLSRREYAFRGEATLYPCHYNTRWLFSLIPRPLSCRLALRSAFPCGRTTALLRSSHESSGWVVPLGRWRGIRDRGTLSPCSWPHTFWFKPISTLCIHAGLSNITAFISTYFKLTYSELLAPDRLMVPAVVVSAHAPTTDPYGSRLRCPPGFVRASCPHAGVADRWRNIG